MDNDLNRAAAPGSRRLMALYLGACFGGTLLAGEPGAWTGVPSRISAPANSVENSNRFGAAPDGQSQSLFIREPSSDFPPASDSMRSAHFSSGANGSVRPVPNAPKVVVAPPQRTATSGYELKEDAWSDPEIELDPASVMAVFSDKSIHLTQPAARKDKASRQEISVASLRSQPTLRPEQEPSWILPGFSVGSLRESAAKALDDAAIGLSHRASLSAAAAATESLRKVALALDLQRGDNLASTDLAEALLAMSEAEDFVGRYGNVDSAAIARMVRSHETRSLKEYDTSNLTGIGAADIYMDFARQRLGAIAVADPLAAHALGLLAKSYRQRSAESPIALAASVHLMRAAASAAPTDRGLGTELAAVLEQANLHNESQFVLAHVNGLPMENVAGLLDPGMSTEVTATSGTILGADANSARQAIRVEQIAPEAFASISRSEAGPIGDPASMRPLIGSHQAKKSEPSSAVSSQAMYDSPGTATESSKQESKQGNVVTRAFKSVTRIWR